MLCITKWLEMRNQTIYKYLLLRLVIVDTKNKRMESIVAIPQKIGK